MAVVQETIRITCRNKCLDGGQAIDSTDLIAPSVANPKASNTVRNTEIRILCGSI